MHSGRLHPAWLIGFVLAPLCACASSEGTTLAPALRQSGDPWVGLSETPPAELTLNTLLGQLVDLSALAKWPDPPFTSQSVSSHDPAADTAGPEDAAWFANRDFLELEGTEPATLLDVRGPGVLTRLFAVVPKGTVRIHIDDSVEPTIEAPLQALLSGAVEPFVTPFAFVAAGGHNLYFPIPFAKSCRVTLTGPAAPVYYQIAYRRYAEGVAVQSFGPQALQESAATRELVRERLEQLRHDSPSVVAASDSASFQLDSAEPDRSAVIEAPEGGAMIWQLRIVPGNLDARVLRGTVLSIAFDGTKSVRVPIGDFFALGVGRGPINSVPIGVAPTGAFVSRWPMPFEREARITLESAQQGGLAAEVNVTWSAVPWTERSLHFHADWLPPDTFLSSPPHDWTLAQIEGNGLYVGNALNVVNRVTSWWGEGDEKIYVDGEAFPSHIGTGTEDYYGYAYCSNQLFSQLYNGHPTSGALQNFGYEGLYRFHVLDVIPFQRTLRFDLEVRHWARDIRVTYDAASFWYARPGASWSLVPADHGEFQIPPLDAARPEGSDGPYRCGG